VLGFIDELGAGEIEGYSRMTFDKHEDELNTSQIPVQLIDALLHVPDTWMKFPLQLSNSSC